LLQVLLELYLCLIWDNEIIIIVVNFCNQFAAFTGHIEGAYIWICLISYRPNSHLWTFVACSSVPPLGKLWQWCDWLPA
jgi:hypothetical protein